MSTLSHAEAPRALRRPIPWRAITERAITTAQALAPLALRASLAVVFIWFGALKVTGDSPVAELVANAVPLFDAGWFVPLLGYFEIGLGIGLLLGAHPLVVATVVAHLAGTFTVLLVTPDVAFQGSNPLLLTTEGEFVMKNLVLLAAALALVRLPRRRRAAVTA